MSNKLEVTLRDLSEIKQFALQEWQSTTIPKEFEDRDFTTLCYVKAVSRFLAKNGVNVSIEYNKRTPYETAD